MVARGTLSHPEDVANACEMFWEGVVAWAEPSFIEAEENIVLVGLFSWLVQEAMRLLPDLKDTSDWR